MHLKLILIYNICTSIIFFKIILNRIVKASAFFFSKEWPFWAPFKRPFIMVKALKIEKTTAINNELMKV